MVGYVDARAPTGPAALPDPEWAVQRPLQGSGQPIHTHSSLPQKNIFSLDIEILSSIINFLQSYILHISPLYQLPSVGPCIRIFFLFTPVGAIPWRSSPPASLLCSPPFAPATRRRDPRRAELSAAPCGAAGGGPWRPRGPCVELGSRRSSFLCSLPLPPASVPPSHSGV